MRIHVNFSCSILGLMLCLAFWENRAGLGEEKAAQPGQTYSDVQLGLTLTLPEGWATADEAARLELLKKGYGQAGGEGGLQMLLVASRRAVGAQGEGFNASLIVTDEEVSGFPGVRSARDYAVQTRQQLARFGGVFRYPREVYNVDIGGEPFAVVEREGSARVGGRAVTFRQKYLVTLQKGRAVCFIATYGDLAQWKALTESLGTVKFATPSGVKPLDAFLLAEIAGKEPPMTEPKPAPEGVPVAPVAPVRPATTPAGAPGSVADALTGLKSDQDRERSAALRWLADATVDEKLAPDVAKAVAPLLQNENTARQAIGVLQRWGAADCAPALLEYLKKPVTGTDKQAIEILGRLKDKSAAPLLASFLPDFFKRDVSEKALAAIGADAQDDVLPLLNHKDRGAQESARRLLKGYKTPADKLVDQCIADLKDEDRRDGALDYLAEVEPIAGKRGAVVGALGPIVLKEENPRDKLTKALGRWASRKESAVLLKCTDHTNSRTREWAVNLLIDLEEPKVIPVACEGIVDAKRQWETQRYLTRLGSKAESQAASYLKHKDPLVRARACEALRTVGTRKSLAALASAAKDKNLQVKSAAELAIAAIKRKKD